MKITVHDSQLRLNGILTQARRMGPTAIVRPEIQTRLVGTIDITRRSDRALFCGNNVDPALDFEYRTIFGPRVAEIYEQVRQKTLLNMFPPFFWSNRQGLLNSRICVSHGFTKFLGLNMTEDPIKHQHIIDQRLFPLVTPEKTIWPPQTIDPKYDEWQKVFVDLNLSGLLRLYDGKPFLAIRAAFPWAFDLFTDEGHHLHPWAFSFTRMWDGREGRELGLTGIRHSLERHLGVVMNEEQLFIDPRFFPSPTARDSVGKAIRPPRTFQPDCGQWLDFFQEQGLLGFYFQHQAFNNKPYFLIRAAYPWAFNLLTPEGQHLHPWDFIQLGYWDGPRGLEKAATACRHVFRAHLNLQMEPPVAGQTGPIIDPRFLAGRDAFLNSFGFTNWEDFERKYLPFLVEVRNKQAGFPVGIPRLLRWLFPWAFDSTLPAGQRVNI